MLKLKCYHVWKWENFENVLYISDVGKIFSATFTALTSGKRFLAVYTGRWGKISPKTCRLREGGGRQFFLFSVLSGYITT